MTIEYYEGLNRTPALPLAVKGWAELVAHDLCANLVLLGWDHRALVYFVEKVPVGVLTYTRSEWAKEYHVNIGYVLPGHRRQGIYGKLWEHLVGLARADKNILAIEGSTHRANKTMLAVAKKQGRTVRSAVLGFDLDP